MSRLRIATIVEGQGEVGSIRILLDRIWRELLGGDYVEVLRPVKAPSGQLLNREGVQRFVAYAVKNLSDQRPSDDPALVLLLIDADERCPARLGPELLAHAREAGFSVDVTCVVVNLEYETWFVAAAESLTQYLDLSDEFLASELPEDARHKKGWIKRRFRGAKYSETQDQPRMTAAMNLDSCRRRSPSFDKLCRELEQRLPRGSTSDS
jgi:Domain of unknown function (DUF4276)